MTTLLGNCQVASEPLFDSAKALNQDSSNVIKSAKIKINNYAPLYIYNYQNFEHNEILNDANYYNKSHFSTYLGALTSFPVAFLSSYVYFSDSAWNSDVCVSLLSDDVDDKACICQFREENI